MSQTDISLNFLYLPSVIVVTAVRFLAALLVLVSPMWGLVLSTLFDIFDAQVLLYYAGITRAQYHIWDKTVDWIAYITEFLVTISYGLYLPFFLLLFLRFAGQFMFTRTHKTAYFILFPNFFETAFFWLILFHPRTEQFDLSSPHPWTWLIVFLILKESHEILLHYFAPKFILPYSGRIMKSFWTNVFRQK